LPEAVPRADESKQRLLEKSRAMPKLRVSVTNPDDGTLFGNANPMVDLCLAALQAGVTFAHVKHWLQCSYEVSFHPGPPDRLTVDRIRVLFIARRMNMTKLKMNEPQATLITFASLLPSTL
jgi:alkylhydroperoxidase family enzyme